MEYNCIFTSKNLIMASLKFPISMPAEVKKLGQKGSKEMFGEVNLSGYIRSLIISDCKKRKIYVSKEEVNK